MSGRSFWKSEVIGLFALFRRARTAPGTSRKRRKKAFFLRYPRICLNPHLLNPHLQGKTPWVDQSCADCPAFPVLGAGDAPPPELHPGASECAPGLAFAFTALRANSWICCPSFPTTRPKTGRTAHVFAAQVGNGNSAQSFSDRSFWKSLRVVDVRAFESWMSAPKCLFFQGLEGPDRSFEPGDPRE